MKPKPSLETAVVVPGVVQALRMISIAGARTPCGSRKLGWPQKQIPVMEKHQPVNFLLHSATPALSTRLMTCHMSGDIHAW